MNGVQKRNPTDFGDPLTFHLTQSTSQKVSLFRVLACRHLLFSPHLPIFVGKGLATCNNNKNKTKTKHKTQKFQQKRLVLVKNVLEIHSHFSNILVNGFFGSFVFRYFHFEPCLVHKETNQIFPVEFSPYP